MAEGSGMVFFSTVAVGTGMPFHTSVAAAKGAIEGYARAMAAEYAPKLRVNVIAPSLVDTPLSERLLSNDKKREMMADRHPLKRVGSAADIANAAAFLLDSENSWITGQIVGVDGGMSSLNVH
jgi:NAD(P)-dependent dehydrogenase (short-subunit alcohol dehydrogenase family)